MQNQFDLMREQRFWPLFVTQFLGAFNDNLFKQALSVMVAYEIISIAGMDKAIVVSLTTALFVFPFIIITPLAGDLAEKYDKARIMRMVKLAEIAIALLAALGLVLGSVPILLVTLCLLAIQSAFFGPAKFSILPQHLKAGELIAGNALINTGTYVSILAGIILGSVLAVNNMGQLILPLLIIISALAGYWVSRKIPDAPPPRPDLKPNWNTPAEAYKTLIYAASQPQGIFAAMMGISWFYFVSSMMLYQFPNFVERTLAADVYVLVFFMIVFSAGISLGGLLNNRLLEGKVVMTYVPLSALGIALFALDLYFASGPYRGIRLDQNLMSLGSFLSSFSGWRIVFDLVGLSLAGGLYVVPLKSYIQDRVAVDHKARVIAASLLMDWIFIFASSLVAIGILSIGFQVKHLFLCLALLTFGVAYLARKTLRSHPAALQSAQPDTGE